MADRYQGRPFSDDDYGGEQHEAGRAESDPLAELARLIGQTDPFGSTGRANAQVPPRAVPTPSRTAPPRNQYQPPEEEIDDVVPPPGPPPWLQRANQREMPRETPRETEREPRWETPKETSREAQWEPQRDDPAHLPPESEEYPAPVHPLHRYAAQHPEPVQQFQEEPAYDEAGNEPDPSRYDNALYGQIETGAQDYQREPVYPDDPYAYQDGYEYEEEQARGGRRRGGLMTIAAVLALAVVGTGAAFAYRTYFGSPRSGEPPIIRADNSPTKIVPPAANAGSKVPDRMATADGSEKIVPREEAPVDVNARTTGPRVVFPPLNQNNSPPTPASVSPSAIPAPNAGPAGIPSNGTLPNNEPRRIKTFSVRGDEPDSAATPVSAAPSPPSVSSRPAAAKPTAPRTPPTSANASAPLSLSPQARESAPAEPRTRMAATNNPVQIAPGAGAANSGSGGGYLVQVSSQRNESDAQASYRSLQSKFPAVLGAHSPVIKRADLGGKGVYYRAMVGPFGTSEEAAQFCGNLKSAGGQCVVQRN